MESAPGLMPSIDRSVCPTSGRSYTRSSHSGWIERRSVATQELPERAGFDQAEASASSLLETISEAAVALS